MYLETDKTLLGRIVYEGLEPNGDIAYYFKEIGDKTDEVNFKRIPKHLFDLKSGNSEIVSDISTVLDADLYYPTMLEQLYRFEKGGALADGIYDDYEDFEDMDLDEDHISEHELRVQSALANIREKTAQQFTQKP